MTVNDFLVDGELTIFDFGDDADFLSLYRRHDGSIRLVSNAGDSDIDYRDAQLSEMIPIVLSWLAQNDLPASPASHRHLNRLFQLPARLDAIREI